MDLNQLIKYCELAYLTSNKKVGFDYIIINDTIAISGTDHNHDWYLNASCFPLINGYHRYFYLRAKQICKKHPNIRIFTGHSAGGVCAHICADLNKGLAISFGAPRIKHGWGKHYSVELQHDPITKININAIKSQATTLVLPGLGHHTKLYKKGLMLQNLK